MADLQEEIEAALMDVTGIAGAEHAASLVMPVVEVALEAGEKRAGTAEAKLAEVRQTVATFLAHYGHSTAASFKVAQDLAEGIRQVLDRAALETQDRGDEKGGNRG